MSESILKRLNDAETALRENLHRHDLDPTAHAHMERALNHVREAYVATNEIGKARSVQRFVSDLEKVQRLTEKLRRRQASQITAKPIRI